jgi:hypothetical protein
MTRVTVFIVCSVLLADLGFGQGSPSFGTYMNPVIPGDHPDCTLTRVGDDYYTTGSSFNVTPVIYHSTDLVHWEAIAQPVSASWSGFGDLPGGGCSRYSTMMPYGGETGVYFTSRLFRVCRFLQTFQNPSTIWNTMKLTIPGERCADSMLKSS